MQQKRKYNKLVIASVCTLVMTFVISIKTYAIDEAGIKKILDTFSEFYISNNIIRDAGRTVAWAGVKGLSWIAENCEFLYKTALGFVDFTNYNSVTQYVESLKALFVAILAVSLVGLGITFIIDGEKKPKILKSLFLIGLTISASSYLLTTLSQAVRADAEQVAGNGVIISDVINSSVYDLIYIDAHCGGLANMKESDLSSYHYPSGSFDIDKINITEVINTKSDLITTSDAKEILGKKIYYTFNGSSTYDSVLQDVSNGVGINSGDDEDIFNEFYYRYKVDYFYIYISLLAIVIVYICMSYKVIRLVFEIVTGRILALLYSANINGTQKTIKILEQILNAYIVLLLTAVLIKLFTFGQQFINNIVPYDQHPLTNCLLFLFLAFSVVDGPNIIQQITGIDAGLSSGVGKIIAGYHMASGAGRTVAGAFGMANQQSMKHMQQQQTEAMNNLANATTNSSDGNTPPGMVGSSNSNAQNQNMNQSSVNSSQGSVANEANTPPGTVGNSSSLNKEGGALVENTSSNNGEKHNGDPLGQNDLENKPSMPEAESQPQEMIDLSGNEIPMGNMAEQMNKDLSDMEKGNPFDMNGASGLGIQSPTVATDDWGAMYGAVSDAQSGKTSGIEKGNYMNAPMDIKGSSNDFFITKDIDK